MDDINAKFAWELLFTDPETGEELRPISSPSVVGGAVVLLVTSQDGSRTWRHIVSTEEV